MTDDDRLNKLFLEELAALDGFSSARAGEGQLRLGSEDPDVRRLVEAMAFFSARTRAAAADATQAAVIRMAGGTLDELLAPMPAAAMVQLVPNDRFVDPTTLEKGASLRFRCTDPAYPGAARPLPIGLGPTAPAGKQDGFFTTLQPVVLRPITVVSARITGARRASQLEIRLSARVKQKSAVGLDFYVRRQGDYRGSLALHVALQDHAHGVVALFDDDTDEEVRCSVQFRPRAPTGPADDGDSRHPLSRIRSFFHFPEQDLYVCVDVPERPWKKLTLRFTLDADWPEEQGVSSDSFLLHVVPAVNAWADFTAPILHDGTRAVVPLQSAAATREAAVATSVRGVYQVDRAMAPLLPLALGNQGDGYEVIRPADGGPPRLRIRLSDTLDKPRKLLADVAWSQPSLWSSSPGALTVTPQQKALPGVDFQLVGSVRRPQTSLLALDPARCLDVLALKMRPVLDRQGVIGMMEILGATGDSAYRAWPAFIDALTVSDAPDPVLRAGGIKHVYQVSLRAPPPTDAQANALHARFVKQIATLLQVWTQDAVDIHTMPSGGAS
ncbi:MAG: type VI secretion system baseplate subunit TssF [Byssovorax sp.]